jgi:hypothetical protein
MHLITIAMFAAILLISLGITAWAARRTRTTADFYAAGKGLTAAQNGFALSSALPDSPHCTAWTVPSMLSARWWLFAQCYC